LSLALGVSSNGAAGRQRPGSRRQIHARGGRGLSAAASGRPDRVTHSPGLPGGRRARPTRSRERRSVRRTGPPLRGYSWGGPSRCSDCGTTAPGRWWRRAGWSSPAGQL